MPFAFISASNSATAAKSSALKLSKSICPLNDSFSAFVVISSYFSGNATFAMVPKTKIVPTMIPRLGE